MLTSSVTYSIYIVSTKQKLNNQFNGDKMTQKELIALVADKSTYPKATVEDITKHVFSAIADTLVGGDNVRVEQFGVFKVNTRAERNAHNPSTGKSIVVPEKRVVKLSVSKSLKEALA